MNMQRMKLKFGKHGLAMHRASFSKMIIISVICLIAMEIQIGIVFFGGKAPYFSKNSYSQSYSALKSFNKTKLRSHKIDAQHEKNSTSQALPTEDAIATFKNVIPIDSLPLCPLVPPNLEGQMMEVEDLHKTPPNMSELEAAHPEVKTGGRFRPPECTSRHKVAIIIPYRNREVHLRQFLSHMHPFLQRQQLNYGIFVIEQDQKTKFNRAMLMNIGFIESLKLYDWQCFVFHDVDLLPENDLNIYSCPTEPRHMSVAVNTMNYRLPYYGIFGGVAALTKEQMKTVNGYSNEFWGWGGEDDDMKNRISHYGYGVQRYSMQIARYTMLKHDKDSPNPDRYNKLYNGSARFKTDGLNSTSYYLSFVDLKKLYTLVNVELTEPV